MTTLPTRHFPTIKVAACWCGVTLAGVLQPGGAIPACAADAPATQPAYVQSPLAPVAAAKAPGAGDLMPLHARAGHYAVKPGKKPEHLTAFQLEVADDGLWRLTLEGSHVTLFQSAEDGAITIPREQDLGEKVEMFYTPALPMLPAHWPETLAIDATVDMLVKDIKSGHQREKGTCTTHIELLGHQRVATPAGEFDAYLVRETRHIKLKMAKADVVCDTWYVPGKGDVAEHTKEKSKVLGMFGEGQVEDARLAP